MKKLILILVAVALTLNANAQKLTHGSVEGFKPQETYTPSFDNDGVDKAPVNVILMIGDGNGLAHIASAMYTNGGSLTLTNLKTMGLVTTQSANAYTTDSAASGTAYATGHKTNNDYLGVDTNGQPLENIPEKVARIGMVSGVVSTDNLDGATPGSFFAHQPRRYMANEIWGDLPQSKLIFAAAGSKEAFEAKPEEIQNVINKEFMVVDALDNPKAMRAERLAYLPPKSEVQLMEIGRGDFLTESTEYAIEYLSKNSKKGKGFFLMVEGACIDKSSHSNKYEGMVKEVLDFDKAVTAAIKFAEKDGNTLVIISADHETGGLILGDGKPEAGSTDGFFSRGGHSATPVPLFAYGPSSHIFMGVQGNDEVSRKIMMLLLGE